MPPALKKWKAPEDLDKECLALCKSINECVPGVLTVCSCCGHGNSPFRIFLHVRSLSGLPKLLYWMKHFQNDCHKSKWRVEVYTDCAGDHSIFLLEGPIGAFAEAESIAKCLRRRQ